MIKAATETQPVPLTSHDRQTIYGSQWEKYPAARPDLEVASFAAGISTAGPNGGHVIAQAFSEPELRTATMPPAPIPATVK